jgi:hypothetical protein
MNGVQKYIEQVAASICRGEEVIAEDKRRSDGNRGKLLGTYTTP